MLIQGTLQPKAFLEVLVVLDLFLKLIDRIIDLLRGRARGATRVFEDLVEPLFNDMPLVVQDYLDLFRQAEALLRGTGDQSSIDAITLITQRREQLFAVRRKVQELTHLVETEFDDEQIRKFARAVAECFYSLRVESVPGDTKTDSTTLVGLFELLRDSQLSTLELHDAICEARHNLERSWTTVTRQYAKVRLAYVYNQRDAA